MSHLFWRSQPGKNPPDGVYHEKQSRELCAVHALNNLFQQPRTFTKQDLDDLCCSLAPDSSSLFNPHRSIIGLGNYDVNVIMAALQIHNCDTVWFDKRKNIDNIDLAKIKGFILNIPTDLSIGYLHFPIKRKHWIAVCQVENIYYNLDSKLETAEAIGDETEVKTFLKEVISCKDKELLMVVSNDVNRDSIWLNEGHKTTDEIK